MHQIEQMNRAMLANRYPGAFSVRIDSGEVYVLGNKGWIYFGHIDNPKLFG